MKKTFIISYYTFLEVYRSKVMYSIFFIALGLVLISYIASELAYGAPAKVALDFGFGLTSISNLVMSLFIGTTLLSKEIESRTLYMVLSRPISRVSFMVGKVFGLSSVLIINSTLLSLFSVGVYYYLGGQPNSLMFWAAWFSLMEAFIIMLFAVLFSLLTSNGLAVVYTIVAWVAGHTFSTAARTSFVKYNPEFGKMLNLVSVIVPDLEKVNLRDLLIYEQTVSNKYLFSTQSYVCLFLVAQILFISFIFKNKNLD